MSIISSIAGPLTGAIAIGALGAMSSGGGGSRALLEALSNPSLCFVPIYSESVRKVRTAEIATSMIMAQAEGKKQFITDNSAPKPRVWHVVGYLRSLIPYLESTLNFKPTIMLQKTVLDQAMISGFAIPFKTNDGELVDVLISSLEMEDTPQSQSSVKITVSVQEVPVLLAEDKALEDLSNSQKFSLPKQQLAMLGAATLLGASAQIIGAFK